jgi:hypothetical protein
MNMKYIQKGKTLFIPDIHQDLWFANKCLEYDFDHVISIGDLFHTRFDIDNKKIFGCAATCEWVNQKFYELGDRAIWLCGNHDIAQIASYNKNYKRTAPNPNYYCSGWTRNSAKTFNKLINPHWFESLELCCKVGDFIVSHAGFHPSFFSPYKNEIENIDNIYKIWEKDKFDFRFKGGHWIWVSGKSRDEHSVYDAGSPIWCDFHEEFEPLDETQQIVGHTASPEWLIQLIKSKNGLLNFNLDSSQEMCMIWDNGELIFINVKNDSCYRFINSDNEDGYILERTYLG